MISKYTQRLLFLILRFLNKLCVIYSRFLSLYNPKAFECKLEEMYQQQIDLKISKKFDNPNLNHNFQLKNKLLFYTPNRISNYRVNTLFTKEEDTIKWIDEFKGKKKFFSILVQISVFILFYVLIPEA